jgi:hypothetical protein
MYDPNLDAEERLRKIAMQQLMANNKDMAADIKVTPAFMPAPEVAPPEVPEASMMDQMMQNLANSNYQGMAPINPIGVTPVQRGGGVMQAIQPQMAPYGTGLITGGLPIGVQKSTEATAAGGLLSLIGEDGGSDTLRKIIAKAVLGGA